MNLKRISVRQILVYGVSVGVLCLARPVWPAFLVGCGFAAAGIAFRIWGCGHLRKNQQLTTSGPYAHVQHPLYLGTFLVSLGWASQLYVPQRLGSFGFGPLDQSVFHVGQAFLKLHLRFPYRLQL